MRTIYPMSDSDKNKILSVIKFFEEIYPSYEHFIAADDSYTSKKENLEIIEKLSDDLTSPLSDDLLIAADDLFTCYQGCHCEDPYTAFFNINSVDRDEPFYTEAHIEKAFDKFFMDLENEAEKRG